MSTASAFSGEMYSTRQCSFGSAGAGLLASRSSAHRNAASVLPDPVGAITSVFSPPAIDDHAPACAGVGSVNAPVNHSRVSALNPASGSMPGWAPAVLAPLGAGAREGAAPLVRVFAGMYPSCLALRTIQPGREDRYGDAGRPLSCAKALEAAANFFSAGKRDQAGAVIDRAVEIYTSLGATADVIRLRAANF